MALSNIFREPRREITESLVGLSIFAAVLVPDYYLALWFQGVTGGPNGGGCPWPVGMFFGLVVGFILILGSIEAHELGDAVCNALQRRDLHLRPKQRRNTAVQPRES
jgi:hypothetical protein